MRKLIALLILIAAGCFIVLTRQNFWPQQRPQERIFDIKARKYAYQPAVIRVNKDDRVTIHLTSQDVTHGFYLEGYDINAKIRPQYKPYFWLKKSGSQDEYSRVKEASFIASRPGKFRYRCSVTCGYFHPFMQGELIVEPNFLYAFSLAASLVLAAGMLFYLSYKR